MKNQTYLTISASILATTILFSGCSQMSQGIQNTNIGQNTKYGTAIGAAAGSVIGNIIGKDTKGTVTGASVGAILGGVIGYNMDKQATEISKALDTQVATSPNAEAQSNENIIITKNDEFVKVTFRDKVMFATNSSTITTTARYKINKLVNVLHNYPETIVQVVGHTDNRGTHAYNQTLSQKRAREVASLLSQSGVPNRIIEAGCSFDKPIAPNTSAENMNLNRRVEIFLYPNQQFVKNQCL